MKFSCSNLYEFILVVKQIVIVMNIFFAVCIIICFSVDWGGLDPLVTLGFGNELLLA